MRPWAAAKGMPAMTDEQTLGQVLHEARRKHNPKTERPRGVAPWDQRAGWQQELDEKMASDLEAEVRRCIACELKQWRRLKVPGVAARDTADEAIAIVLRGGQVQERSDEKEPRP